jgi:hypothetical protein
MAAQPEVLGRNANSWHLPSIDAFTRRGAASLPTRLFLLEWDRYRVISNVLPITPARRERDGSSSSAAVCLRRDRRPALPYSEFEKSNGESSENGSLSLPEIVSFCSISSREMSDVDWMPCSLRRNSSGFDARRSASSSVIRPLR